MARTPAKGRGQKAPPPRRIPRGRRGSRRFLLVLLPLLLVLGLLLIPRGGPPPEANATAEWRTDTQGLAVYPLQRGPPEVEVLNTTREGNLTIERLQWSSHGANATGVLFLPANITRAPALVHMTGAGVPAKDARDMAEALAPRGIAVLSVEKRAPALQPLLQPDHDAYIRNREPVQHQMAYDMLRGFDLLRQRPEIDPRRIAASGDSIGGRFAIMAAALDPALRGALGISTFGDGSREKRFPSPQESRYAASIDPDTYAPRLGPRPLFLVHDIKDATVPLASAERLLAAAKEPKHLYKIAAESPCHGFCPTMTPDMVEAALNLTQ
ncbi:MAG: acetylxylan esterase [Euryarchaeota archaeon]|nr:acetylxylan esterase [Euryarchaeota archaeon]